MPAYDIVIVANSPGELSALVKPAAEAIAAKLTDIRITLVLTPCQYASGKEIEYIKGIKGIGEVIDQAGYKNWILRNHRPNITFKEKGIVLYLGGDLAHAVLVARKLRFPAYAYVQDFFGWGSFYKMFFVPDAATHRKFAKNDKLRKKLKVIGNLMVDSIGDQPKWAPQKNIVTFMPGSRDWQVKHMTPIYENLIALLKSQRPELIFQLVSSPFEKAMIIKGTKIIKFEEIYNSELVLTIPGTNTARLAALGMPMLVLFPLDNVDVIPLEGPLHYICKIPHLGSKFKHFLADTINQRTKFFALPNIKAGRQIVPELRGKLDLLSVAKQALALLDDPARRQEMSANLRQAMGEPGAALKLTEEINEALRTSA